MKTGQRWPCAGGVRYVTMEVALWIEVRAEDTNLGSLENRCPLKLSGWMSSPRELQVLELDWKGGRDMVLVGKLSVWTVCFFCYAESRSSAGGGRGGGRSKGSGVV